MPHYTVLSQAGKARLIRSNADTTATVVTTVPDPVAAPLIAKTLTAATSDLPHTCAYYVLDVLDAWVLDPDEWRHGDTAAGVDWAQLSAPTGPFSLRRRVLNIFDAAPPENGNVRALDEVVALGAAVAGQPESVRRAVRDEIAAAYRPYDTVPVIARAYDYKNQDVDRLFLANAGLELLDQPTLDRHTANPSRQNPDLLDVLEAAGLADFSYAEQVANAGYLDVDVNAAQLAAWVAARR